MQYWGMTLRNNDNHAEDDVKSKMNVYFTSKIRISIRRGGLLKLPFLLFSLFNVISLASQFQFTVNYNYIFYLQKYHLLKQVKE